MRYQYQDNPEAINGLRITLMQLIFSRHVIHLVHWNVKGIDFEVIHTKLDKYIKQVSKDIDMIAEMMKTINTHSHIPDLLEIAEFRSIPEVSVDIHSSEGWAMVYNEFGEIMKYMRNVYDNLPSNMQSDIDTSVSYYDKEANYKIVATLD